MKKILNALFLCLLLASFSSLSFASIGVQVNGKDQGQATGINFTGPSGTQITNPYGFVNVPVLSSTLIETGVANGGAASMATTDSNDLANFLGFALVKKAIASDPAFGTGVLPNGTPGQVITFEITGVVSSGTYTITPTTATGFTTIKFGQIGQYATLVYFNSTIGWYIEAIGTMSTGGAGTTLPTTTDVNGQ